MTRTIVAIAASTAALLLAACATPADRITAKLVELGVPAGQARCMGDRLADRLTTDQLRQLGTAANVDKTATGRISLRDIVHRLRDVDAPVAAEVVRAGLGCVI